MAKLRVVPTLRPEGLLQTIQNRGLEDSLDLIAAATPAQIARVWDVDLWRAPSAGADEVLDAERFGYWIAVLGQAGAEVAAEKLAGLDTELVIAGFAQHLAVFHNAAVAPYATLDGEEMPGRTPQAGLSCEIGGYMIEARRASAWDAIVDLLLFLDAERPEYFHRLIGGCMRLSSAPAEANGFHDLLEDHEQQMFDVVAQREARREGQGFVTPAQAHAFLREGRSVRLDGERPAPSAVARAYFRAIGSTRGADIETHGTAEPAPERHDHGLVPSRQSFVHAYAGVHPDAEEELAFLANAIVAGGTVQGRPFTAREASEAAVATCNLGLQNWPLRWAQADLITAFQAGWTLLHRDVAMFTARHLTTVLQDLQCSDREIQLRLDGLRHDLLQALRGGEPWRTRDGLEVIMMLDAPAWAALSGLIDEHPVMHAALLGGGNGRTISATAFTFISQNSDVAKVREFLASLPSMLTG